MIQIPNISPVAERVPLKNIAKADSVVGFIPFNTTSI
jgi:hypothetical protein